MNRRLQQFINAENISQSQFADNIGVARASVSHIISGRNKPGFDFVEKMARAFPALNVEWLITGRGKMYKNSSDNISQSPAPQVVPAIPDDDLFASFREEGSEAEATGAEISVQPAIERTEPSPAPIRAESPRKSSAPSARTASAYAPQSPKNQRKISKIVVFYDDNSYEEVH